MKRLESMTDRERGVVTYEFGDGRRIAFDERNLHKYGIARMLQSVGINQPDGRVAVFQGGRKVGTVPAYFDPLFAKSANYFYDPRPGDFTRTDDGWNVVAQLGPGDLEAIPEFVWDDDQIQSGRAKRAEDDRALLVEAVTGVRRKSA